MKILALLAGVPLLALSAADGPIVQVRELPNASTISIVAWDAGDATVGLRTRLRTDGSLLGQDRSGEHRLYLSSSLVDARGGFAHAVNFDGKLLRNAGDATDEDACRFDNVCSPKTTVGLGIPDDYLRQHRDSIVVTMRPRDGQNWTVRLDRTVIDAYLRTIDSVSAALKAKK